MNADRLTVRSREALERAQRIARDHSHQELRPEHLLAALLAETDGTIAAVLQKLGVDQRAITRASESALASLPRVQGGTPYLGNDLRAVLDRAEDHASRLKDEFVSVEHLALALADPAQAHGAQRVLANAGVTGDALLKALATVRGGQRVTDESPEDKY